MNYYVYYKVTPERVQELRARIDALLKAIEAQCGVRGRLMHRRDDPSTYMEVYEDVKNESAFEALLEREGATISVPRHVERFVSV
jgi:hypothetical protein